MIAFDTNLLVRALVADHAEQVAIVRQLIARDIIFISRTVLFETPLCQTTCRLVRSSKQGA